MKVVPLGVNNTHIPLENNEVKINIMKKELGESLFFLQIEPCTYMKYSRLF